MTQHETKNTIGTLAWCNTCNRRTLHSVSGKRLGHCQEHEAPHLSKRQEKARKEWEHQEQNPKLF